MAHVVFLRGANVGGQRVFQPALIARELAEHQVVNVGAAGTFVVCAATSKTEIGKLFTQALPFKTELMVCPAKEILALLDDDAFDSRLPKDTKQYLTIMAAPLKAAPRLPKTQPDGEGWSVKIVAVRGRYVLSLHRRMGTRLIYPNEVVERQFGQPATTRNWSTIMKLANILNV